MGSPFLALLGQLITRAAAVLKGNPIQTGTGIAVAADLLNLDFFRQNALRLAPGSDANALEEVARMAMRLMNLDAGAVFWPRDRISGEPIPPMYMVLDFNRGRAWFTSRNPAQRRRWGGWSRGGGRTLRTARRYMQRYRR